MKHYFLKSIIVIFTTGLSADNSCSKLVSHGLLEPSTPILRGRKRENMYHYVLVDKKLRDIVWFIPNINYCFFPGGGSSRAQFFLTIFFFFFFGGGRGKEGVLYPLPTPPPPPQKGVLWVGGGGGGGGGGLNYPPQQGVVVLFCFRGGELGEPHKTISQTEQVFF